MFWHARPDRETVAIAETYPRAPDHVTLSLRLYYSDRCWLFIDDPRMVVEGDGADEDEEEDEEECNDMDAEEAEEEEEEFVDDNDI